MVFVAELKLIWMTSSRMLSYTYIHKYVQICNDDDTGTLLAMRFFLFIRLNKLKTLIKTSQYTYLNISYFCVST